MEGAVSVQARRVSDGELLNRSSFKVSSLKDTSHYFNHIDNLAVKHDVTVSNTMIKVTYNKGTKDSSLLSNDTHNRRNSLNFEGKESKSKPLSNSINIPKCLPHFDAKTVLGNNHRLNESSLVTNKIENKKKATIKKKIGSDNSSETMSKHEVKIENNFKKSEVRLPHTIVDKSIHNFQVQKSQGKNIPQLVMTPLKINPPSVSDFKTAGESKQLKASQNNHAKVTNVDNKKRKLESEKEIKTEQRTKGEKRKPSDLGKEESKKRKTNESAERVIITEDNREILLDDPDLPPGWQRIIHTRSGGASDGQLDVHILSPEGKRFRFRAKLKRHLEEIKSPYNIDQFYFGLYKKPTNHVLKSYNNESKDKNVNSKLTKKKSEEGKKEKIVRMKKNSNNSQLPSKNKLTASEHKSENNLKKQLKNQLPPGWKKCISKTNKNNEVKLSVYFVSPDGKKFHKKKILYDYLEKVKSPYSINQFHFNIDKASARNNTKLKKNEKSDKAVEEKSAKNKRKSEGKSKDELKTNPKETSDICQNRNPVLLLTNFNSTEKKSPEVKKSDKATETDFPDEENSSLLSINSVRDASASSPNKPRINFSEINDGLSVVEARAMVNPKFRDSIPPMLTDPKLPEGWRRAIKVRSMGDSAGRMEVMIVSPDGKKHRNKGALDLYLKNHFPDLKAQDFDFTVHGKNYKKPVSETKKSPAKANASVSGMRSSVSYSPAVRKREGESDSREGLMITAASGIMIGCGLATPRSERRLHVPRNEHEKILKEHLETNSSDHSGDVSVNWIRKLVKCRSEFGALDEAAAQSIASATANFLKHLAGRAFEISKSPENGLEYDNVADFVEKSECLSPLKPFIPKKITFKEFIRLNRPTKFSSFT